MTETDVKAIFSANFKRLRVEKKMEQKDVADALGVSSSIVSDWEKGNKMPRAGALQKISVLFNVPQHELLIERGVPYSTFKEMINLPVVGRISCGNGSIAYEEIEGYESTPKEWLHGGDHFYLRAKGDSMTGARIFEGDLLLIRKQGEVENGEIAAVLIGDEAYLKRVYRNGETLILQSENPNYPPIFCPPAEAKIIGRLKKIVVEV
ncbi:XRE family transcriptional regulator [Cohnella lubricantis]|uniref:Helix-turn-helix domain-containing protein n=1 Tax=Cohnella lubricantis TaxID=2163172 RepID=A0A841TBT9_9BACL|nr:XRE family transcriptional regulator [Cohnella lubricantis]MBB6677489.1 helix-turn-helix domain-containing protein [Cohnella lubricantis]MBP2116625.1 repressor LexA [Cohnella lubricantis]